MKGKKIIMIEVKNLCKTYKPKKGEAVQALKGIDLKFEEKGLVFILGKSGSGKSTLLNMLGGLDKFDDGEIIIKGKSSKQFSQSDFDSYRNTFIGFIFQEYNILNDFTVGANIALAMELQGRKPSKDELNKILEEVDLSGFAGRKPNELSGGQKQRVAIARALIKNPEIIMADEPTGALDSNTGKQVFDTLKKLSKDKLVIVVSHDRDFAEQYGDRVIELADGEIISDIKKYLSKPQSISEGISVIEDKIIHIKSGYELTSNDLEMINNYLKNNKNDDSFISIDGKTNQEIKKAVRIDENGYREGFEDTSEKNTWIEQYDPDKFKLIRSKLPVKNSLKMAFGSLKKKPFRLIVTIFLSMVAFALFGLSNTMSSYNKIESGTDSIVDSKVDYTAFTKNRKIYADGYSYESFATLSDEDVNNIKSKFPDKIFNEIVMPNGAGLSIENIFDTTTILQNGEYSYYASAFLGVSNIDDKTISDMGYSLEGKLPEKDNEVAITKYVAESFVIGGYCEELNQLKGTDIKETKDLIGKTLNLSINGKEKYTITGILDTNFNGERYKKYKEEIKGSMSVTDYMLVSELNSVRGYSYNTTLFTTKDVFDKCVNSNVGVISRDMNYSISFYDNTSNDNYYNVENVCELSRISDEMKANIVMFDNKDKLEEDEVILPLSAIIDYLDFDINGNVDEVKKQILANMDIFKKFPVIMETYSDNTGWIEYNTTMKIVGIYVDLSVNNASVAVLTDGIYDKYDIYSDGKYNVLMSSMPKDSNDISELVKYSYDDGIKGSQYVLNNCTTDFLTTATTIFESLDKVFLYVGVFFAIFAAIMLMNFIATSISYKKREIGILRAVGARGTDVFMIFFNESLIIAIINWLAAIIGTSLVVTLINNIFRNEYNMVITLLHFGIVQVVLMFVISITVAFVSSFIPVYKVSRKKPIEAIRKN